MRFRRPQEVVKEQERRAAGGDLDAARRLPDEQKENLCRDLLGEFGVTHIREAGKEGELIHGCLLPFSDHRDQDRNPTASLNYLKLTYNCLGSCQSGGSLMWFIGTMRDTGAEQARKWLLDKTGIGEGQEGLSSLLTYFDEIYDKSHKSSQYGPMPHMDASVLEPWLKIHPYMTEVRGIPEDTLMKYSIGFAEAMRMRIGEDEFIESPRIVIPHFWRDSLVGWQSRRLVKDGTPKYKNSPDFPKDRTLYNYDSTAKEAVIVESPMSVLSKDHTGHLEATFGASITDRQMKLISMHPKVTLFCDNDDAGWKMTHKLGEFLVSYSEVYVAQNPYAADPADLDDEAYQLAVDEAVPYSNWSQPKELVPWSSKQTL